MKYLIFFVILLSSCGKTPTTADELKFSFKSEYGSWVINRDGIEVSRGEVRGTYEQKLPRTPGNYTAYLTSVPPGFSYIYLFDRGQKVTFVERSHSNRVNLEITYTIQ